MARPQRRWWWQSHLFDNDGGKLLRAFERRRRLARLHDASPEAQRSHRASRSAEGDGRLCACDVATKNSPHTKCLSQLSQFQSGSQLNGDGVKVRGWQSDSLEPAAFEHSWYLCYKALVEGWEQVRVIGVRLEHGTSRDQDHWALLHNYSFLWSRDFNPQRAIVFHIDRGIFISTSTRKHAIRFAIHVTPCSS